MNSAPLVPGDFAVPAGLRSELFVIEPLDVRHNLADHAAWTSSIDHIRATPGFARRTWPRPMSLEENAADLAKPLHDLVRHWLAEAWPFEKPDYAER